MTNWAHLDSAGVVTNVSIGNAEWGSSQGLTSLDGIDPQPGIGWTLTNGTWTAPPPPVPDPVQVAKATAVATLRTLDEQGPTLATQLEADIASVANWATLTPTEQQDIVGRMLGGLGLAQQALQAHVTATGVLG